MERFEQITPRSKYVSLASVLTIITAIFGFGYGWTGTHGGYTSDNDQENLSVSYAVGNGLKPVIVTLVAIGGLLTIYTLYLRKGRLAVVRYLAVAIISCLLIAITYVNPLIKNKKYSDTVNNAHYILAVTAFTITMVFNLVTYYLLYKNYLSDKWLFLLLGLVNFGIYLGMYVIVYIIRNDVSLFNSSGGISNSAKEYADIGAAAEIIQILFFLLTILLMGYYKTGIGVITKK
jgi:hypothetical protein